MTKVERAALTVIAVLFTTILFIENRLYYHPLNSKEQEDEIEDVLFVSYDPFKSGPRESLSPYDYLFKQYADSINWDWHLLAAIAYQESKFDFEAKSHRGARGLMQLMPATAARYNVTDASDPEQSIRAAAFYLRDLSKRYRGITSDTFERQRLALAAYNAGEGRVSDCIRYARIQGQDPHSWEELVEIIPEMKDSVNISQIEEIKHGVFYGHETINYVRRVTALEKRFKTICP